MECTVFSSLRTPIGISHTYIVQSVLHVLQKQKRNGSVSVSLIGDTKMKSLNKQYRGKNTTTDVLSFAMEDGISMPGDTDFGDMFISIPQIKKQAKTHGISFKEEFTRMMVHGTLHLLGYDHMVKKEATIMFSLQEQYVADLYE